MLYHTTAAIIPMDIAAKLPPIDLLRRVLAYHIVDVPADCKLVRAAWNPASVWPDRVTRTYRYGPHNSLRTAEGFPYHWVYAAEETLTAVWEAQFCSNPATHPGHFIVAPGAESGLIVTLSLNQRLRLFDLSGIAASRLGIYDQLRSPDYEWCQWFGYQLDQLISEHCGQVHGFVYPSRRQPGALAYAISSRVLNALQPRLSTVMLPFAETVEYAELLAHPCHIDRNLL